MLRLLDNILFALIFLLAGLAYGLAVARAFAKDKGGDAAARWDRGVSAFRAKAGEAFKRLRASAAGALNWLRAARGVALEMIAEHAPLLRSRTISGAFAQKIIALLPFAVPAAVENDLIRVLCIVGIVAMFARIVHGRAVASGPIITPRDREGRGMGPGAQSEHAEAAFAPAQPRTFADPQPRTFADPGAAGATMTPGKPRRSRPRTMPA